MAKKLTKAQIVKWLNTQIKAKEMQAQVLEDEYVTFHNFSASDYLHIDSKALRHAAELLELKLEHRDRYDTEYPHEIYFMFGDVMVMALESDVTYYEKYGAVE